MNKLFKIIQVISLFLLTACGGVTSVQPTMKASSTPSRTPMPSSTPRPTFTAIPTATEWVKIYPTKQALVVYGASSRNQRSQLFIERGDFYFSPFLTLYADGQLIFGTGVYEKQLSQNEVDEVAAKLKQLGFFALQDAYDVDRNSLFDIEPRESFKAEIGTVDISVFNGQELKSLSYGAHDGEYLIQPVKAIVDYLKSFSSKGAKSYQPDRLLVGIETEKQFAYLHNEEAAPWPDDITPPSEMSYDGVLYLEGDEAIRLNDMVNASENNIFIYDDIKFQVYLRPILPNECHVYHYYPDPHQPSFTCDNW